jgi:hypothetical protein
MTTLEQVKQTLIDEIPYLRQLGISQAGVFGSVARGDDRPDSDVDILIELNPDHHLTLLSMVELELKISEKLNKKVELVIGANLKPGIKAHVLNEVVYVYA